MSDLPPIHLDPYMVEVAQLQAELDRLREDNRQLVESKIDLHDSLARLRRIEKAARFVVGSDLRPGYDRSENEEALAALRAALEEK